MTNMCSSLHCLPSPGGLYDQDCLLVEGMHVVLGVQKLKSDKDWDDYIAKMKPKGS